MRNENDILGLNNPLVDGEDSIVMFPTNSLRGRLIADDSSDILEISPYGFCLPELKKVPAMPFNKVIIKLFGICLYVKTYDNILIYTFYLGEGDLCYSCIVHLDSIRFEGEICNCSDLGSLFSDTVRYVSVDYAACISFNAQMLLGVILEIFEYVNRVGIDTLIDAAIHNTENNGQNEDDSPIKYYPTMGECPNTAQKQNII